MTKAALYVCLSGWNLGLSLAAAYSNAAKGMKEEQVEAYAVSIMRMMTNVFVVGSFLILFIKAT